MEFHEVASIFPMMNGEEFAQLKEDIQKNGLIEPVWTYQGKIIDGRNRYRACVEVGIEPKFREWIGTGSLVSFIVSMNLHRRHLNSGQKATAAFDSLPMYESEARERQLATLKRGDEIPVGQKIDEREGRATEQAARDFGTNRQYISDVKAIAAKKPELVDEIRSGEKTITQAKREIQRQQTVEKAQEPTDKYRIIYADPPWKYGDTRQGLDGTTGAETHYSTMSISELCSLPVYEWSTDDAVLFLWVTSPILAECWPVINAWGFKYKASFVWDKVKHNMGHYNSVRHELLLICTKGSCLPESSQLVDSVQTIERSERHSQKPEEFRSIIDTLYPHGKRLEMFAREKHDGWDVYGNAIYATV